MLATLSIVGLSFFGACRAKKTAKTGSEDAGVPPSRDAAMAGEPTIDSNSAHRPLVGLAALDQFAYSHGPGQPAYKASSKAARSQNWETTTTESSAAISADPNHLAALWLHGESLAVRGEFAAAVVPLLASVAGDFRRFGDKPLKGEHWDAFRASSWAASFDDERKTIGQERRQMLTDAPLFLGRSGPARDPRGLPRSEVFAYSEKDKRFIRVSRTAGQAVGFIRSPSGNALAVVSYSQLDPAGGIIGLAVEVISMPDGIGTRFELGTAEFSQFFFLESKTARGLTSVELVIERQKIADLASNEQQSKKAFERKTQTIVSVINNVNDGTPALNNISGKKERAISNKKSSADSVLLVSSNEHRLLRNNAKAIAADWSNGSSDVLRLRRWRKTVALPIEVERDSMAFSADGSAVLASSPRCRTPKRQWIIDGATGRFEELPTADSLGWSRRGTVLTIDGDKLFEFDQRATGNKHRKLASANGLLGLHVVELPCAAEK